MKKCGVLVLAAWLSVASAAELKMGLSEALDEPLVQWSGAASERQLAGGLLPELNALVASRLDRPMHTVLLARKRVAIALVEGETDIHCYQSPEWFGPLAGRVQWSVPLFSIHNRIIRQANTSPINTFDDLRGQAIGTTLGYVYPALEPYFRDGRLHRDDAGSELQGFRKFTARRINYLVMNSISLDWHLRTWSSRMPAEPQPISTPLIFDPVEVRCAVGASLALASVNRAIESLRADGSLEAMLRRYR